MKVGRGYRVTFASTINCAGIRIPTMIISEVKKEPEVSKWARKLCVFRTHEKAWINNSNMLWWVNTVFVPHVEKIRMENDWPKGKRALLYVDKHTTRNSVAFLSALEDANIDLVILPGGSTSICQPLDVSIFGPTKAKMRKYLKKKTSSLLQVGRAEYRVLLIECTLQAFEECSSAAKCSEAFEKTGLMPVNWDLVLKKKGLKEGHEDLKTYIEIQLRQELYFGRDVLENLLNGGRGLFPRRRRNRTRSLDTGVQVETQKRRRVSHSQRDRSQGFQFVDETEETKKITRQKSEAPELQPMRGFQPSFNSSSKKGPDPKKN